MDDATALMLEKIKVHLEITGRSADIQARRHVAVLAVALAAGASTVVGAVTGQVQPRAAAAAVVIASAAITLQVHGLGRLTRALHQSQADAIADIDSLMVEEDP